MKSLPMTSTPRRRHVAIVLCLIAVLVAGVALTTGGRAAAQGEKLRVVTKSIPPFVFTDGPQLRGFSIELWQAIATEIGREYEFIVVNTVGEQIEAITSGAADVAVAAITITAQREEILDFSLNYYRAGLGILTKPLGQTTFRDAFLSALSPDLFRVLGLLGLVILVAGHLVWLLERGRNPDFPDSYLKGVWEGIWWAAVTITTVGYGDKTPRGVLGRILGLVWMFAGLFIIANFTATVTASLTTQRLEAIINGPDDLPGKVVATAGGTTADQWLTDLGIQTVRTTTIEEAIGLLSNDEVQAVVYDYPVLRYYLNSDSNRNLIMPVEMFDPEFYGIAFPTGSPLREDVNRALLNLVENGTYHDIHVRWFGEIGGQ